MILLRKSYVEQKYDEHCAYQESFYNICDSTGDIVYNSASGAVLSGWKDCQDSDLASDAKILLVQNGFFVRNDCNEFETVLTQAETGEKGDINFFTIVLTTACNARCFYCYEEDYCKQTISEKTIDNLVDYIDGQLQNNGSPFTLDWYGGEPLLCVSIIDDIISKLSTKGILNGHDWTSSITTNATLFNDKLINHAVEHWKLSAAHITIDGTEQQHNQRKNVCFDDDSAYRATWNAVYQLLQKGVYVNLRVHLDRDNKDSFGEMLDDIAVFFDFDNFHLFPTFLFPPEYEMPANYIKDDEKEMLFFNVFKALNEKRLFSDFVELFPKPKTRGCFATNPHSVVVSPDGSLHACVQEFSSARNWDGDQKFSSYLEVDNYCVQCKFFPICLGGCIHTRFLTGTVRTPCVRNRYVIKPLLELLNKWQEAEYEKTIY